MTLGPSLASAEITGSFVGGADADLIELSGVAIPPGCGDEPPEWFGEDALAVPCTFELTTLRVGDTETGNNTEGGLSNGIEDNLVSFGHGSNFDAELLTADDVYGNIAAELLVQADAYQPGGPVEDSDQLLEVPGDPLVTADAFTVSASATDISAGNTQCPDEDEFRVSHGFNETLNLRLGPDALSEDGGDVLAVQGVSYALSQVDLVDSLVGTVGDGAYGVRSTAEIDLATTHLLDGNLQLESVKPRLVATHDGNEFSWTYDAPDVVLTLGGTQIFDGTLLNELDESVVTPLLDALAPLTDELEPLLKVTLDVKSAEEVEVAGNTATVSDVVFLSIELLEAATDDGGIEVLSLSIGDLAVTAEAPAGGVIVDCEQPPLTVVKDGPETVEAGESFDYTITVTNELECTATDVVVVDTITGPAGFEVTSTDPEADSVEGGVVTWTVDDDLEPGDSIVFTVTVSVPTTALPGSEFANTATADANCDDVALPPGTDTMTGPRVADDDIQLPRTGGGLALLAMGALAAAGVMRRR